MPQSRQHRPDALEQRISAAIRANDSTLLDASAAIVQPLPESARHALSSLRQTGPGAALVPPSAHLPPLPF